MRDDHSPLLQAAIASWLAIKFCNICLRNPLPVPDISPLPTQRQSKPVGPVKWNRGDSNPRAVRLSTQDHQYQVYLLC